MLLTAVLFIKEKFVSNLNSSNSRLIKSLWYIQKHVKNTDGIDLETSSNFPNYKVLN